MPKDYSKSKIYKIEPICDHDEGDIYIGSTTQNYISHRLAEHVRNYKGWKNEKNHFISSFSLFEKYGIDNVRIVLLESCPCTSNDELRSREAYYQKQNKCVNKIIAFRSKEERKEQKKESNKQYIIEHHDEYLEYQKQYRIEHFSEISEQRKQYREENRDEILEKQKQYRIENRDKLLKQMKQYREEHKQEISEKKKEKIICECGRQIRKDYLKTHQISDLHKQLMSQLHDVENKNDAI